MSRIARGGIALAASAVLGAALAAPAAAQSACTALKLKAGGGYFASFARCLSKGVGKGVSPDPLCVAKAQTKLASSFEKAERKDDCLTLGDFLPVQDVLDDALPALLEVVDPPPPVCCAVSGLACLYTLADADCTGLGGVPAAAGFVCSGSGACVAPDAVAAGPCCETSDIPPQIVGGCLSGPVASMSCDMEGDIFLEQGRCHPALGCFSGPNVRSRCTAAKLKAAGSYFTAVAKCEAKAAKQGDASADLLCLGKAQSKLQRAFEKAEKKGDCLAVGDLSDAQAEADEGLDILFQILEPPPSVCCEEGTACFWAPDAATCTSVGGNPGAAGSVCGGNGTCGAPPAAEGNCCEGINNLPLMGLCAGGSTQVGCTNSGGSFVADAVCLPAQLCID